MSPLYEYKCPDCESTLMNYRRIEERDNRPICRDHIKPMDRVISSVGAIFKGDGFYSTDNRK
jgi:putative FmdB family regulatory protein